MISFNKSSSFYNPWSNIKLFFFRSFSFFCDVEYWCNFSLYGLSLRRFARNLSNIEFSICLLYMLEHSPCRAFTFTLWFFSRAFGKINWSIRTSSWLTFLWRGFFGWSAYILPQLPCVSMLIGSFPFAFFSFFTLFAKAPIWCIGWYSFSTVRTIIGSNSFV
jgi:hypothetical protein